MSGGSGGGGSSNTVTQVQQIPQYEQGFSQANQDLSQSLAAQPYPNYQGQLVAPFTNMQNEALGNVPGAAMSYEPYLQAAGGTAANAATLNPIAMNTGDIAQLLNGQSNLIGQATNLNPQNAATVGSFMSPYVSQALAPQIQTLQSQLATEQQGINAGATQDAAFGDARNAVANSLQNFYGNLSLNNLLGQGYNSAYQNALSAIGQQQNALLSGANMLGNEATGQQSVIGQEQGAQMNLANLLSGLGGHAQQMGLQGANAMYDAGALQQQFQQNALNAAYQQFENQANWPYQMLNVRESSLSNSPYTIANYTTAPPASPTAQNLGTFAGLAGLLGSGASNANVAPFGGSALPA